jgi:hypothetical protein
VSDTSIGGKGEYSDRTILEKGRNRIDEDDARGYDNVEGEVGGVCCPHWREEKV